MSIDLVYTLFCLLFLLVVLLRLLLCVLGTTLLPFMRLVIMTLFERRRKVVLFLRRLLPCARERERERINARSIRVLSKLAPDVFPGFRDFVSRAAHLSPRFFIRLLGDRPLFLRFD